MTYQPDLLTDHNADYKCLACGDLFWVPGGKPESCVAALFNECDAVGQIVEIDLEMRE